MDNCVYSVLQRELRRSSCVVPSSVAQGEFPCHPALPSRPPHLPTLLCHGHNPALVTVVLASRIVHGVHTTCARKEKKRFQSASCFPGLTRPCDSKNNQNPSPLSLSQRKKKGGGGAKKGEEKPLRNPNYKHHQPHRAQARRLFPPPNPSSHPMKRPPSRHMTVQAKGGRAGRSRVGKEDKNGGHSRGRAHLHLHLRSLWKRERKRKKREDRTLGAGSDGSSYFDVVCSLRVATRRCEHHHAVAFFPFLYFFFPFPIDIVFFSLKFPDDKAGKKEKGVDIPFLAGWLDGWKRAVPFQSCVMIQGKGPSRRWTRLRSSSEQVDWRKREKCKAGIDFCKREKYLTECPSQVPRLPHRNCARAICFRGFQLQVLTQAERINQVQK